MSATFAGSRTVDERRRRRLACEADDEQGVLGTDDAQPGRTPTPVAADGLLFAVVPASRTALSLTVLTAVAALGLTGLGRYFAIRSAAEPFAALLNPLLGQGADNTARCWTCICLLLAGQLAVLIRWYRSCSRVDYSGNYAAWGPLAVGLFGLSLATHIPVVACWNIAFELWLPQYAHWSAAVGLIVLAVVSAPVLRVWIKELRPAPAVRGLLLTAAALQAALVAWSPRIDPAATASAHLTALLFVIELAAPLCVMLACLVFARRVMHVSLDPLPETKRAGRFARFLEQRRLRREAAANRRQETPDVTVAASAESDETDTDDPNSNERPASRKAATAKKAATVKKTVSKRKKTQPAKSSPADVETPPITQPDPPANQKSVTESAPVAETADPPSALGGKTFSVDPPQDLGDQLKGLSKRQRRELRKQLREQQRAAE